MMAPIFPHIADELWHRQGQYLERPSATPGRDGDPDKAREEQITVVVQIGGKVRDKLQVAPGTAAAELRAGSFVAAQRRQISENGHSAAEGDRRARQTGQPCPLTPNGPTTAQPSQARTRSKSLPNTERLPRHEVAAFYKVLTVL
jgi:leucyl-tRNA synthetase